MNGRGRGWPWLKAPIGVALLAAVLLSVLTAFGRADLQWSAGAAALILGAGLVAGWRFGQGPGVNAGFRRSSDEPPTPPPEEVQTYVLALELAPNPVLLVSAEDLDDVAGRRVVFANAEARDLLRIEREGALLVTALRHPTVLEAIDEALFGRIPRMLSYETGGAQERSWRVWTKPLPPNARHPRLALVIMRDETDVRRNERMRADFLANASHELRTPLASLTGFIETLRGHARDDAEARDRFLIIMSRQAERMARLIDDLLSLSRIELNEHIRPGGQCDLSLAVGDVLDALAPQIAAKQVRVEFDLAPPGAAEIVGDRDQIVQVAQNLLDNAVKYAPNEGLVRVSVARNLTLEGATATRPDDARQSARSGGRMPLLTPARNGAERYALLRVDDGGPGMAREHLPRLTERFYRVEGQKSGERTGTGLGLAIVKHIVNRHRGGFYVESAPGHGAAFSVYLPMTARAMQRADTLLPTAQADAGLSHEPRAA
ncbi:cell wall metabolism sensor histidine kinase WalK [Caulobacter sp. S45]|uniref:sensor histidine kinase n=1 Tax=Caulobacter sp. S45 TaxID=1641861 RepID=UPI0020C74579|nr:ATP-binding protein [Caulobacter sp. S45]